MDYLIEDTVLGIKGYLFEMRTDTYNSPIYKKEHTCFCDNRTRDLDGSDCLANGLLDLQKCVGEQ